MSDDELKLNRRIFLQHSAMATAVSATWYSVAMKTDALAQQAQVEAQAFGDPGSGALYPYFEPPE